MSVAFELRIANIAWLCLLSPAQFKRSNLSVVARTVVRSQIKSILTSFNPFSVSRGYWRDSPLSGTGGVHPAPFEAAPRRAVGVRGEHGGSVSGQRQVCDHCLLHQLLAFQLHGSPGSRGGIGRYFEWQKDIVSAQRTATSQCGPDTCQAKVDSDWLCGPLKDISSASYKCA
uniref:DNA replication ATP-dependent helicase/nuclease n=1 Tax=Mesocestoides corti TaxID=53468 RepID=A0A5K3F404_MESCO